MLTSCEQRQLKLFFSAKLEEIDIVCLKTREFLTEVKLSELVFEIELLVREALINAVVHGSNENEKKKVDFKVSIAGEKVVIEVQDEGPGFDWKNRMKKTAQLSDDSGRGIMIFNSYAEKIEYNEKGNKLTLQKSIV